MTKDCKDCIALKILDNLERELRKANVEDRYVREAIEIVTEALETATRQCTSTAIEKKPKHLATGTCLKPGCNNKVHYDADAHKRPMYCKRHMPEYVGRNEMVNRRG